MSVQSVHHINLRARPEEVLELRKFYVDVVGLSEGWRPPFASRGHWLYAEGHPVVHLVEMGANESVEALGRRTIDHVAFRCTDMDAMIARLRSHGVSYAVSVVPAMGDKQMFFRDPLGNGVELSFSENV